MSKLKLIFCFICLNFFKVRAFVILYFYFSSLTGLFYLYDETKVFEHSSHILSPIYTYNFFVFSDIKSLWDILSSKPIKRIVLRDYIILLIQEFNFTYFTTIIINTFCCYCSYWNISIKADCFMCIISLTLMIFKFLSLSVWVINLHISQCWFLVIFSFKFNRCHWDVRVHMSP